MQKRRWVLVALPTIRRDLGASLSEVEWTVNAYTLSVDVLLMCAAALGDRYGRRRMFGAGGTLRWPTAPGITQKLVAK